MMDRDMMDRDMMDRKSIKKKEHILIIGGGPAGLNLASKLSRNFSVTVVEEHPQIGLPVQCTGLITESIQDVLPEYAFAMRKIAANRTRDVKIFAPNKKFLHVRFKRENLIFDRKMFDSFLANKAHDKGAEILTGKRFSAIKDNMIEILDIKSRKRILRRFDSLVGADGPRSFVARTASIPCSGKFFTGMQFRIRLREKIDNCISFYPYIKDIAWVVPEDDRIARVGVMSRENPLASFRYFEKILGGKNLNNEKIDMQAGLIPVYNPRIKSQKGNIFLVGDAASQAKATTGGGIIPGIAAGNILASELMNENPFYDKKWKASVGRELWLHLKMRDIFDTFSCKDWNSLVKDFSSRDLSSVLAGTSRDNALSMSARILLKRPLLARYALRLFRH